VGPFSTTPLSAAPLAALFSTVLSLALAGVLLWSGLDKLRDRVPNAATLRRLGVTARLAGPAAGGVALLEVVVALGLVWRPGATWVLAGVAALATAFAAAGALALRQDEPIHCSCFAGAGGRLGWRQLALLPAWLAAATWLHAAPVAPAASAAARFAFVALALASLRAAVVWRARGEARGDRLSATEMYAWLPQR